VAVIAYILGVLAGGSHLFNALTGGDPMHSFSARVGHAAAGGKRWAIGAERLIDSLLFNEDHCREQARFEKLI
jgi:hypothetical protein